MLKLRGFHSKSAEGVLRALEKSLAIIEFDPSGRILFANENFCATLGYTLAEIQGRHHSLFVEPQYAESPEYKAFWAKLGRGEFDRGEYKRITKDGRDIWIQATYNPVMNARGKVLKIVKAASDITREKRRNADFESKLTALSRAQAVIEFTRDGEIVTANENFLSALGYRLDEIVGRHHRMFVDPAEAQSQAYKDFWAKLGAGEYIAAEFRRLGKGGREVWIQASYNPIFDANQTVVGVVKFATDVTHRVQAVNEIGHGLVQLAARNFEHRIDHAFQPEFEKLRSDYNSTLEKLQSTLQQVRAGAGAIQSGSQDLSRGADDLSRRTEQQAASIEQTAAALDEITATVRKTAAGATHVREAVTVAKNDGEQSSAVVQQTMVAMAEIQDSARKIGQIIGVIDEIAFQTSLLALNAGVEAARAGDAGRGFAVVASEVRALAQRSASAAKEIKALISTSTEHVDVGVGLVSETGKALKRIIDQIVDINGLVADIAASAQEQATGLDQVNNAVNQMDQVTQRNAAMVEQSTAATQALSQEAEGLAQIIGEFRIGGDADPWGADRRTTHGAADNPVRLAQDKIAAFARGR
jgi:methyl-accepting chemotaxis protein